MCDETAFIPDGTLDWATENFFKNLLKSYENNNETKLIRHTIEPAVAKGQNFLSALYRIKLHYTINDNESKTKIISLVVKAGLEELVDNELNVFQREAQVYNVILKHCNDILERIDDRTEFAPKVICVMDNLLVMEDLNERNYKMLPRKTRLDLDQSIMVLEKLAKFHAATAVLYTEKPELLQYHKKPNLTEVETPYHEFYRNSMEALVKFARTRPNFKHFVEKLDNFHKNVIANQINVFTRDENSFNCLNHGDMWVNNMLFGRDKDDNLDVILVDYQEGFYGSPGIDLNFFVYTSCTADVQDNHLDELIGHYHSVLFKTLEQLNYKSKLPTLDDIQNAIRNKFNHALTSLFCITPIQIIENVDDAEAGNFIDDSPESIAVRDIVYSNPKFEEMLNRLLPRFVEQNLL